MEYFQLWCFLVLAISASASETTEENDKALMDVVAKYVNKVPDLAPKYVVSEDLSQVLSRLINRKISMFPLFRISLKLDRRPVKIPWSVDEAKAAAQAVPGSKLSKAPAHVKEYKLVAGPTTQPAEATEKVAPKEPTNETKSSV